MTKTQKYPMIIQAAFGFQQFSISEKIQLKKNTTSSEKFQNPIGTQ